MASLPALSGCGGVNLTIPESLRAPCESTVNVENAETVGDLGQAIIQGDADLRVCSLKKDAVVEIVESQNRRWYSFLWPG